MIFVWGSELDRCVRLKLEGFHLRSQFSYWILNVCIYIQIIQNRQRSSVRVGNWIRFDRNIGALVAGAGFTVICNSSVRNSSEVCHLNSGTQHIVCTQWVAPIHSANMSVMLTACRNNKKRNENIKKKTKQKKRESSSSSEDE